MSRIQRFSRRELIARTIRFAVGLPLVFAVTTACSAYHTFDVYATSPTTIPVGATVSFAVDVSWTLDSWSGGSPGSPPPDLPFWGSYTQYLPSTETFAEYFAGDNLWTSVYPDLMPGIPAQGSPGSVGPAGHWSFSLQFPNKGTFDVMVTGAWAINWVRSRNQYYVVVDCLAFTCGTQGPYWAGFSESGLNTGYYDTASVRVAVVPEPTTSALLLTGLGLLGGFARHRGPKVSV